MPVGEQALRARLAGSTAVTSQVSTRIYPVQLPQDPVLPALTYEVVSSQRESVSGVDSGDVHSRMQVTSWAATYAAASAAIEGVRAAVQRWTGTSTGVVVQGIFLDNEYVFFDDETESHAHVLDLIVHYEE